MAKEEKNPVPMTVPTRAARIYWTLCALVGLALTVLVNGAHAKQVMPDPNTWTAVVVAVIPPLMFAALFEGFFLARRVVPPTVLRMVKASIVVLGGASFAISYTTIAYFIQRRHDDLPAWTAWVMPGLLDLFVAVSAYVVYVLSKHSVQAPQTSTTPSTSSWRRLVDAATARAEAALIIPASLQAEPFVEARGGTAEPVADAPVEPAKPSTTSAVEVRKPAPKPSVDASLEPFMETAQRLVDGGVVARKSAVELARVIRGIEQGMTDNAIKSAGIASASTAAKVRMACSLEAQHPSLAVV
ncbi:hypothetical protein I3U60_05280 [Mycobacteroides abscessus subsp. massiliense]|uniref:hypothetical protein n=1 Tax=Mycobacteroides abscessus TaxID=36809 RepID=UPI0019D2BC18|nr:hypothetical protein [Mycobacteroides abscessus]MBN7375693.1 hypothetical protein [Mycobacteroides abscessus subsp. massiliense]